MPAGRRIMIVDDEERVRFVLKSTLQKMGDGYEILTASDGYEALARLRERPCGLVITDLRMPGLDGLELIEAIRHLDPDTSVILMTAYGNGTIEAEAQRLAVHRYLSKPFDVQDIRRIAAEALASVKQAPAGQRHPVSPAHLAQVRDCLASLRTNVGAHCAFLISAGGQPVGLAGLADDFDVATLSALVAANFLAANEIAKLLGKKSSFKLSYHEGDDYNVYAYSVEPDFLLVVVFGQEVKAGTVWFYAKKTVGDLRDILSHVEVRGRVSDMLDADFNASLRGELDVLFGT